MDLQTYYDAVCAHLVLLLAFAPRHFVVLAYFVIVWGHIDDARACFGHAKGLIGLQYDYMDTYLDFIGRSRPFLRPVPPRAPTQHTGTRWSVDSWPPPDESTNWNDSYVMRFRSRRR